MYPASFAPHHSQFLEQLARHARLALLAVLLSMSQAAFAAPASSAAARRAASAARISGLWCSKSEGTDTGTVSLLANGITSPTDLSVDAASGRLYIVSRADHSIYFVPLQ